MADNNVVQKIDPNVSQEDIIKTLNDNFETLTKRIKNNNITLSFLDLLRLDTVWSGTWRDTTPDSRLQNFISTVWNTLANYSGVLIQYTSTSGDISAFTYANTTVNNGDYLVKLPGAQFVHVKGQDANYYKPTSFNYNTGSIEYTLVTAAPETVTISFTTAANSGLQVQNSTCLAGASFNVPGVLKTVRWFYEGEEVLWSNSYQTNTNSSGDSLQYIAYYQ